MGYREDITLTCDNPSGCPSTFHYKDINTSDMSAGSDYWEDDGELDEDGNMFLCNKCIKAGVKFEGRYK